jgi:hypothetical protein
VEATGVERERIMHGLEEVTSIVQRSSGKRSVGSHSQVTQSHEDLERILSAGRSSTDFSAVCHTRSRLVLLCI